MVRQPVLTLRALKVIDARLLWVGDRMAVIFHGIFHDVRFSSETTLIDLCINPVITIHEGDPVALGMVQTRVAGSRQPSVILVDNPYSLIACSPGVTDGWRRICAAIVNEHYVEFRMRLTNYALDAALERRFCLIYGYYDRNKVSH